MEIKEATSRINTFVELWNLEQADDNIQMIVYKEDIEAFKIIVEVLTKHIVKKPIQNFYNEGDYEWICPTCKSTLNENKKYCHWCGQRIN